MGALEINEVPVKFEFDLDEPIKMQTPDGGEILMTFKGDITLIKNNKEIEVKEGNNTQTLTAKGMGMEIENKEKTSPQTSTVDNVSVEFGKTEANIDYDRLFSIVAKNGTTFSAGTHLVNVGNKLYCHYKQEAPESTFTFPDDPLGNSWSGKSHGWTFTVDYRPGDHENADYSGLSPEFVLDEYYFQLLYQLLANEKKSREKEQHIMNKENYFEDKLITNKNIKTQPNSSLSSTIDTLTPLQNLSAAFYPTHALAYRGIDPSKSGKESLALLAIIMFLLYTKGKGTSIILKYLPRLKKYLPQLNEGLRWIKQKYAPKFMQDPETPKKLPLLPSG